MEKMNTEYRFPKALFLLSPLIIGFILWWFVSQEPQKRVLKVLTYSSFSGVYGPGRILKEQFEFFCDCHLQWFLSEDSTALLQRFSMISDIDMVLGWDQMTVLLDEQKIWEDLSLLKESLIEKEKIFSPESRHFLPIDWAPIGFLYRDLRWNVKSLKALPQIEGKISFPSPRSSTLGFQFYYWIYEVFEGKLNQIEVFLKSLRDKMYGPLPSWSMAYGLFQKRHTDMGLSYLSSLLYHQKEEKDKKYFFAHFKEGHPYQVEFLSISKNSKEKALALDFARFLLSETAQAQIQDKHYMFPVAKNFKIHPLLKRQAIKKISYKRLKPFVKKRETLLEFWDQALD